MLKVYIEQEHFIQSAELQHNLLFMLVVSYVQLHCGMVCLF